MVLGECRGERGECGGRVEGWGGADAGTLGAFVNHLLVEVN